MSSTATRLCIALVLALAPATAAAQAALPNMVEISPRLVTSGQPTAEALGKLKEQGFEAVIYLAPPTVHDAVRDEHLIVARQGLTFVNIPVRFDNPTEEDFARFAAVLRALGERKVLVHCQVNMRASSMVFLYRTVHLKQEARGAYDAVTRIWVPHGPWKRLIDGQLAKNGIAFEAL